MRSPQYYGTVFHNFAGIVFVKLEPVVNFCQVQTAFMLVGIVQDCRDRPVAPFIKHHVWYANVIRTRRGEERVAERDLNLFAPSRFRGGGGLHLHKSVQRSLL